MRAEIIYIGTELLLGQILNSNAVFLGQELASLGIDCYFQTIVGDNKDRIKESFKVALQRADLIITTGGLGPTSDDLTTECWAELFNEELKLDEAVLRHIENIFKSRNREMAPSNIKQALRPASADLLANSIGTAPGIIWNVTDQWAKSQISSSVGKDANNQKLVLTFPGVPRELKVMWKEVAFPFLSKKLAGKNILVWKELKFYGIGESSLAEKVQDLLNLEDTTVAPLAGKAECRLRLATKAQTQEEGLNKLQPIEAEIRKRVGDFIYGINAETLESVVGELLRKNNKTLSVAESCTGGLLSQRLTEIPGSSDYIKLNFVTYSNQSKQQILNVKAESLELYGAVSEQVALEMALGAKEVANTNYALSITGIAGPSGGTDDKPVGTVFIALVGDSFQEVKKFNFGKATRNDIRWLSSQEALNWLRQII